MRSFGSSRTHCLTSIETEVVLPTPVEPTIAKWRRVNSSTLTVAWMVAFCVSVPISTTLALWTAKIARRSAARMRWATAPSVGNERMPR